LKAEISSQESLAHKAKVHRTYVGRLERGESGVTVEALAAILAPLGVSLYTRPSAPILLHSYSQGSQMPPEYFWPMLGMGFALGWGLIGTVRWYLKERLQAEFQRDSLTGDDAESVRALEDRIVELEERVDFHERVISQQRNELGSGQ
jgi:transcriptional regulator with XRE-family HTH domain